MLNWDRIKHFTYPEFQDPLEGEESGKLIDMRLVYMLDELRESTGWPILPHWAQGGCVDINGSHGHAAGSMHLARKGCKAVDFHFKTDAPIRMQFYRVCTAGFCGIGVYPDWHPVPGFHVDLRPISSCQRWSRKDGRYFYLL
jgi:hypothetical protein